MVHVKLQSVETENVIFINPDDRKAQHVVGGKHGKAITYFDNHHGMTRQLVIYYYPNQ